MKKYILLFVLCCVLTLSAEESEKKTAAQWLEVIVKEQQARLDYEREHPEAQDLILGCALDLKYGYKKDKLPAEQKRLVEFYRNWWKKEGQDSFGKWRKDGYPEIEGDVWFMFHAKVMNNAYGTYRKKKVENLTESERADLAYYDRIARAGISILKKGYTGALLSRDEIDALRLYAIYNLFIQGTMHPYMYRPWNIGLLPGKTLNLKSGMNAPDFSLDPMEVWLESSEYHDRNDFDFADMFRPAALTEFLQLMSGYETGEDGNLRAKPCSPRSDTPVSLSDYKGTKPVMLIFMDPVDSWWYWGKISPAIEPLYRATKGRIDFYFVATTIHDRYDPMIEFFKPGPGKTTVTHTWSMEERARRCKAFFMAHPNITIPYLLDDLAGHMSTAYRDRGGECVAVLIDKKGTIAFVSREHPRCLAYEKRGDCLDRLQSLWPIDLMDANVSGLLENNGVYSREKMPVIPKWQGPLVVDDAKFKSYSEETGMLTLGLKKGEDLTLIVEKRSRVLPEGTLLKEQKRGTPVYCSYIPEKNGRKTAGFIGVGMDMYSYWKPPRTSIWISADIKAVDREEWIITAGLQLPPKEELKGLHFWQEADEKAVFFDGNRSWALSALKQNLENPEREFRIHIDRGTFLVLNGRFAGIEDLRKGDRLGIELKSPLKDVIKPNRVRVYRFGELTPEEENL